MTFLASCSAASSFVLVLISFRFVNSFESLQSSPTICEIDKKGKIASKRQTQTWVFFGPSSVTQRPVLAHIDYYTGTRTLPKRDPLALFPFLSFSHFFLFFFSLSLFSSRRQSARWFGPRGQSEGPGTKRTDPFAKHHVCPATHTKREKKKTFFFFFFLVIIFLFAVVVGFSRLTRTTAACRRPRWRRRRRRRS